MGFQIKPIISTFFWNMCSYPSLCITSSQSADITDFYFTIIMNWVPNMQSNVLGVWIYNNENNKGHNVNDNNRNHDNYSYFTFIWTPYYFSRVAVTNNSKTGGLKRQKYIISKASRLEVRNQGVGRGGSLETLREKTSHSSLLTSGGSMLIPWLVTTSQSSLVLLSSQ